MSHSITIRGTGAAVKWGYHVAATLGSWTVTGRTLTASVLTSDTMAVSQRPLVFVVPRPKGEWRWDVDSLQIADGTLTASLVPQE
jgi:hypothetical protein